MSNQWAPRVEWASGVVPGGSSGSPSVPVLLQVHDSRDPINRPEGSEVILVGVLAKQVAGCVCSQSIRIPNLGRI